MISWRKFQKAPQLWDQTKKNVQMLSNESSQWHFLHYIVHASLKVHIKIFKDLESKF
jgi:hypothetical protein